MITEVNQKSFSKILEAISKTYIEKVSAPEEANSILLTCEKNVIKLISTNTHTHVAIKIPATSDAETPERMQLDTPSLIKQLGAIASSNKDATIKISKNNNNVVFSGEGTVCVPMASPKAVTFNAVSDELFSVSFLSCDLAIAIDACYLAVNNNNELLSNVKLEFDAKEETLKLVSMNGTILTIYNIPLEDINSEESFSVLINGKVLKSIVDILNLFSNQEVKLIKTNNSISLSSEDVKITISAKNENFVSYQKLLEVNFCESVDFDLKDLKKNLTAIKKIVKDNITYDYNKGIHPCLRNSDNTFSKPVKVIDTKEISFTLPIDVMSNIVGIASKISSTAIRFNLSKEGILEISLPDNNVLRYITGCCK